jgi:hypothetical protein
MRGARLFISLPILLPIWADCSYIASLAERLYVGLAPAQLLVEDPEVVLGAVDRYFLKPVVGYEHLQVAQAEHHVDYVGYQQRLDLRLYPGMYLSISMLLTSL